MPMLVRGFFCCVLCLFRAEARFHIPLNSPRQGPEPDVCNDNTLDKQQVLDFVANGKKWLNIALILKNMPSEVATGWSNPKFKFQSQPGIFGESNIRLDIVGFIRSNSCATFDLSELKLEEVTVATNERCQRITGRATDTFAVMRKFPHDQSWFRFFSQRPKIYFWAFFCLEGSATTTYDFDSCETGFMYLLITDPRTEPSDNVGVYEKVRDLTGLIITDDTRYFGHMMSEVSVLWTEGRKECNFV